MPLYTTYDPATGQIFGGCFVLNPNDMPQPTDGIGILHGVSGNWLKERVNLTTLALEPIPPVMPTLSDLKAAAKATVAQRRWEIETGGIIYGGATVATDDRSKLLLAQAYEKAKGDNTFVADWKMADGTWAELTAAQILDIYDAVFEHIRQCFAQEASWDTQIDAAQDSAGLTALAAGIAAFWPI